MHPRAHSNENGRDGVLEGFSFEGGPTSEQRQTPSRPDFVLLPAESGEPALLKLNPVDLLYILS